MYLPLSSKTIIHLKINWKVARLNKMFVNHDNVDNGPNIL